MCEKKMKERQTPVDIDSHLIDLTKVKFFIYPVCVI